METIGHGGPGSRVRLELPAPLIVFEALSQFVPPETIRSVLTQTGRHNWRIRCLPAIAVVWLIIAIGIWTDLDISATWRQVVGTLRSLLLVLEAKRPPCKSALSQACTRLGPGALRPSPVVGSNRYGWHGRSGVPPELFGCTAYGTPFRRGWFGSRGAPDQ